MKLPPSNLLWCVINSVSHTTGIHLPDQKIALRNPVQGHNRGGGGFYGLRIR
jgi:hypothetical protein